MQMATCPSLQHQCDQIEQCLMLENGGKIPAMAEYLPKLGAVPPQLLHEMDIHTQIHYLHHVLHQQLLYIENQKVEIVAVH